MKEKMMSGDSKEIQKFSSILNEILLIKKLKALDYGNSWRIFGLAGIYYQIGSKFVRLWNLRKKEPENEPLRDTLRDMIVYCTMAIQLLDEGRTEEDRDKIEELLK